MKRLIKAAVIVLCAIVLMTGCFFVEPPSKESVEQRLDKSLTIGYTYLKKKEVAKDDTYYYYRADDGVEFSARAYTAPGEYGKAAYVDCDYIMKWFEARRDFTEELLGGSRFDSDIFEYGVKVYVDGYSDLEDAARFARYIIDAYEPIPVKYDIFTMAMQYPIRIEIRTKDDVWLCLLELLFEGETPPTVEDIFADMKDRFLQGVEEGEIVADIDEAEFEGRKTSRLGGLIVNGVRCSDILFHSADLDDYMIELAETDFGVVIDYNYSNTWSFANIIRALGGEYEIGDKTATWKIGEDVWLAEVSTHIKYSEYDGHATVLIDDVSFYKNGEKLDIERGKLSDIELSLHDLELLTGKTVTVHRNKGCAVIVDN